MIAQHSGESIFLPFSVSGFRFRHLVPPPVRRLAPYSLGAESEKRCGARKKGTECTERAREKSRTTDGRRRAGNMKIKISRGRIRR